MRKKKLEIVDESIVTAILKDCRVGRLGTAGVDGYPGITPVNYVYWNGSIYFHCAREGEKLENIFRDSKVCFEVDRPLAYLDTGYDTTKPVCAVNQFYQSVVVRGRAELVEDEAEKTGALNSLVACHEGGTAFAAITGSTAALALCSVVAIRIESISARENLAQNKSRQEIEAICSYLETRSQPGDLETARLIRSRAVARDAGEG